MLMKRLLLTLVACGAVLLPMAAHAQRGMGFHGSSAPAGRAGSFAGRPGGFAGRPMGHFAPTGIRSAPAGRFMSPRGRIASVPGRRSFTFRSRFGFRNRFHHRNRFAFGFGDCFNGFGFNTFGFNNFGCGSPLFFGGFVDPFFDPFFGASWEQPQPAPEQPAVLEEDSHNRELALQVQELSEEIQAMREDQR